MAEKLYTSIHNFYPGKVNLPAGTVFSEEQWIEAGGTSDNLKEHVKRGNITEAVQTPPPAVEPAPEPEPEPESSEEPSGEEGAEEGDITEGEDEKDPPTGLWAFTREELEPLPLAALNVMYKDHAVKAGLEAPKAFRSKAKLIDQMTSEGPDAKKD